MVTKRADRFDMNLELAVTADNGESVFDFYTINVSETGMLIASNKIIDVQAETMKMVIDPLQKNFASSILCDLQIARVAESEVGVKKPGYIASSGFSTVLGVRLFFNSYHNKSVYQSFLPDYLASA